VQNVASDAEAGGPDGRTAGVGPAPVESIERAGTVLAQAQRPVIIVGEGARQASAQITRLAELLGAPVLTTVKAKGLVPDNHELAGGVLGRSGTPVASWLMNESDLLVVVGASFAHHTGIANYKPIIQFDHNISAIGRFDPVQTAVLGDAPTTLALLNTYLERTAVKATDQRGDVAARWSLWRTEKQRRAADDLGEGVPAAAVFGTLSAHAPADAVIAVDVGNHAYSFGRYFESKGQPVLMSGYLGSIGFGYPAALGAWAADPSRPVIAVTGDGGFGQYLAELTTAVKYGIPIKHVLLDNRSLGKITKEQLAEQRPAWQTSLVNPDFAEYARLCGASAHCVTETSSLDAEMARLFESSGPAMLHIHQDAALV
jgi:thiamine pyrophosphate-dependent acetolactate synthase large subunit-like protein